MRNKKFTSFLIKIVNIFISAGLIIYVFTNMSESISENDTLFGHAFLMIAAEILAVLIGSLFIILNKAIFETKGIISVIIYANVGTLNLLLALGFIYAFFMGGYSFSFQYLLNNFVSAVMQAWIPIMLVLVNAALGIYCYKNIFNFGLIDAK